MTPPDTACVDTASIATRLSTRPNSRCISAEFTDLARLADLFRDLDSSLASSEHSWRTELGLWD
jgi:hypothetical protein